MTTDPETLIDRVRVLQCALEETDQALRDLTAEMAEQCRIIAMSGERELALRSENARLKALGDGLAATSRRVRQGIRALGVKREPVLYEAVMAFDAALAAWEKRDEG